ncbi:MAG TPA: hypothetical protein PKE12_08960 [Kiritimatiellia bacterium]|nr:hypothetical protein [Kiritimatiellia bacterium]
MRMKFAVALGIALVAIWAIWLTPHREASHAEPTNVEAVSPSVETTEDRGHPTSSDPIAVRLAEPLPAEAVAEIDENPITATATITRGDGVTLELHAIDGEFARVGVEVNEVLAIRIHLRGVDSTQPIRLEADHGGSLERRRGPLVLMPNGGDIAFSYAVGGHSGRYPLMVIQGERQELLEFSVGPEPPVGASGPLRIFNPDRT